MSKILGVILGVVVGIIVLGGVLMPVLDDAAADTRTFDNRKDAYFEMDKLSSFDSYVFEWNPDNPDVATVNGDLVKLRNATVLCATEQLLIRYGVDGQGPFIQSVSTLNNFAIFANTSSDLRSVSITIADGTISYLTSDNLSGQGQIGDGFAICKSGDYVMKSPDQAAYMLVDSPLYAMGLSYLDVWNRGVYVNGTVESVEISLWNSSGYTAENIVIDSLPIDNYVGLYELNNISFDIVGNDIVRSQTYNYFIVPAEVTADKSEPAPLGDFKSLVFAIPVTLIIALIAMVAFAALRRY